MKERPILFNSEMIRAVLDGRKTQTRRVVKPQPQLPAGRFQFSGCHDDEWPEPYVWMALTQNGKFGLNNPPYYRCPYGYIGDRLWVRETWGACPAYISGPGNSKRASWGVKYRADNTDFGLPLQEQYKMAKFATKYAGQWRPSIFMPRWASRINLEVTGVRVERVQEITDADAVAEGIDPNIDKYDGHQVPKVYFSALWDSINEKRGYGWDSNPWVWVVEFRKV